MKHCDKDEMRSSYIQDADTYLNGQGFACIHRFVALQLQSFPLMRQYHIL